MEPLANKRRRQIKFCTFLAYWILFQMVCTMASILTAVVMSVFLGQSMNNSVDKTAAGYIYNSSLVSFLVICALSFWNHKWQASQWENWQMAGVENEHDYQLWLNS